MRLAARRNALLTDKKKKKSSTGSSVAIRAVCGASHASLGKVPCNSAHHTGLQRVGSASLEENTGEDR